MTDNERTGPVEFCEPTAYRILVQGALDTSTGERLGGMRVTRSEATGKAATTTLVGSLRDQAALSGVLNTLYEMHVAIIEVEKLTGE